MATKKPICHYAGEVKELQSGDTLAFVPSGLGLGEQAAGYAYERDHDTYPVGSIQSSYGFESSSVANHAPSSGQPGGNPVHWNTVCFGSDMRLSQLAGQGYSENYGHYRVHYRNNHDATWTPWKWIPTFTGKTLLDVSASGNLLVGTLADNASGAKLQVNGGTCLGEASPSIKVKKLTGTTAATEGGVTSIAHGLDATKIIGVQVLVTMPTGVLTPSEYSFDVGKQHSFNVGALYLSVQNHPTNSENILSRPFTALITYEA